MFQTIIRYNNRAKARGLADYAKFDSAEAAKKYLDEKVASLEFHGWHIVKSEIVEV